MKREDTRNRKGHQHKGKSTESHLNSDIILKALNIKKGQTVVDAGCGSGYMSRLFSNAVSRSGKVFALDPDKDAIEILRHETRGTNIEAVGADITGPTRIRQSSVDLLYISAVIHGFSKGEMQGFLAEAKRLLKPEALLAVVEIEKKKTPFGPPMEIRYSPEELQKTIPFTPVDTVKAGEHFYLQLFRNQ